MALTYYEVIHANLNTLTEAAKAWKAMGERFGELRTNYGTHVRGIVDNGSWLGLSAVQFNAVSLVTQHEFLGAKNQATAIGNLLDDAHQQLTKLKKNVENARDDAIRAKMHVDSHGRCTYDESLLSPGEAKARHASWESDEQAYTKRITDAVQAVSDADHGVKLALKGATVDNDGKGMWDGFNSKAKGDVEKYEGARAAYLGTTLNSGGELSPKQWTEFERLMRDNSEDKTYSRTLLNQLGADGTIKLTNRLNDRAYYDDTDDKKRYLGLEKQLATTLKTATSIDGDSRSADRKFTNKFLGELKDAGVEEYELAVVEHGSDDVQMARGYQSIITLMQHGSGYDEEFLHGLADDIRDAEDPDRGGDSDIWDLDGSYSGNQNKDGSFDRSGTGWFANDPLDGALGLMSKDPGSATSYFDPTSQHGRDRLHYLQTERNWDLVNTSEWHGNVAVNGEDAQDFDNRTGFGAALEAAMTGNPPGSEAPDDFTQHSEAERRVLERVVNAYAELTKVDQGGMPENIRQNMGNAIAYYPGEVHDLLSGRGDTYDQAKYEIKNATMNQFIRAAGEDGGAFRTIHDSQMGHIAEQVHKLDRNDFTVAPSGSTDRAQGVMQDSGQVMGSMDQIRADVLADRRDDQTGQNSWSKTYQYHTIGAPVTAVPIVGDTLQRLVDIGTGHYAEGLNGSVADKSKEDIIKEYAENGYPRLSEMIEKQAESVGVTDNEMHDSGTRGALLLQSSGQSYASGLGAAEGSTGERSR
ncbi:hypothetical protein LHJ74_14290 [Streptomyces sp. N2-109]|uniref:Uncharacterized protein n=1 Tax=Streptomyces gossypii TaxID=2883101 RepID=A0ABT2JT69_9ACTN|nr:DUF6571 family protein [Streptomyces gossypii]MCT2591065.1 hypothetical protein [Streptomyces gossypii]